MKCHGPHQAVVLGRFEHLPELDSLYHYFYGENNVYGKDNVPARLEPGNANHELAYSALGLRDCPDEPGRQVGETGDFHSWWLVEHLELADRGGVCGYHWSTTTRRQKSSICVRHSMKFPVDKAPDDRHTSR